MRGDPHHGGHTKSMHARPGWMQTMLQKVYDLAVVGNELGGGGQ